MSIGYIIQGVCDRCWVTRSFKSRDAIYESGWSVYPGGLTLCPHCAALFKNGYSEAHIHEKDESED